jgi:hypothetical protein
MEIIRIIRSKAELEGTAYVELLPGPYKKQCWNDGSLFFEEEVFGYLEPIILRHVPGYDHYAFTEITANKWAAIVSDFRSLEAALERAASVEELKAAVGFLLRGAEVRFAENFQANKRALARLLNEVSAWVSSKASEHGCVTVLGL